MTDSCLFRERTLISKDVDVTIEQIVDYILRDYLFSWATKFIPEDETFKASLSLKVK